MKPRKPRMRMVLRAYLISRNINPNGLTYGPLKAAVLGELGLDVAAPPRNAELRAMIGSAFESRAFKKPPRISFYDTDEWRTVRYQALKRHGGCCQCCGARAERGKPLHVDHIKPRSKYPELALTLGNLQVLCPDCNLGKRAWDETDWRPQVHA